MDANNNQEQKKSQSSASSALLAGLNKRQQVAKANKAIFIWVAVASVVVTLSIVALQFLIKQGIFNQKIISQKSETNKIIVENIEKSKKLKVNIDSLVADTNLEASRAEDGDNNIKVVLDALPTTGDTTSFSNSLYNHIIAPSGVKIDSIIAGDIAATTTVSTASAVAPVTTDPSASPTPTVLPFSVSIQGSSAQTKSTLTNIEKVIRPMNVTVVNIRASSGILTTTISGNTYYMSASKIDLGKKTIKP